MKLTREKFEGMALEQLDTLYRVARRLTGSAATAEDLVQETYVRAIRGWQSFQLNDYGIRPWLIRIMHNLHITRSQREHHQPRAVDADQLDSSASSNAHDLPLTAASFEGMDQQLVKAVEELPSEYQAVLILWAVEELSYKEIAAALEIPIGTVMSRLHRARQRLLKQLQEYAREERIIRE